MISHSDAMPCVNSSTPGDAAEVLVPNVTALEDGVLRQTAEPVIPTREEDQYISMQTSPEKHMSSSKESLLKGCDHHFGLTSSKKPGTRIKNYHEILIPPPLENPERSSLSCRGELPTTIERNTGSNGRLFFTLPLFSLLPVTYFTGYKHIKF